MGVSQGELLSSLNDEQRRAVQSTEGPLLVLAGAGTGKTKVISTRIAYLLKRGVSPSEILAVTFTRKAATEMSERIEHILKRRPWGLTVSTFHALGLRILRELNPAKPQVLGDFERQKIIQSLIRRFRFYLDPERTLNQISRAKNWGLSPEVMKTKATTAEEYEFAECYIGYQKELASQGALDLDDMLGLPLRLLLRSAETRSIYQRRWRYVLVDEYQDTNRVQFELTRCILGDHSNICVVGDDDQSIYGFRGAEVERILSFRDDFRNTTVVALQMNYRSHSEIITLANAIISRARSRYPKRLLSHIGPGGQIVWARPAHELAEANFIADQIRSIVEAKEFSYSDIAIIARVTQDMEPIHRALKTLQIPCALGKSVGENAIAVMSLHQSKGLEFPVVFVPALEDDSLPHYHALGEGKGALEEERRLLYVAVTRAKKRLFLTSSASRKGHGRNVSRFLRELPREVWATV